ncbi:unnamed protein product [Rotaria sordida]|uniref:DNA-directed RNA polymerases I and III subunit RPAC1 n=1 Tax=Rotaria sordida TaxID=392033 RepID=A0A813P2M7_9BILA|nr:unnamed protein product [Rotaria sordida]CAF0737814.1 unnamed protein product [Rotaria sordida]CAF0746712.1 unnamed protein product [Rotaria sordida]CAF0749850.1 unnamed protein product [Rotaria sordida]CAF0766916.1 unnamed protein product [Rotaria sordida]
MASLNNIRTRIKLEETEVLHTTSTDFPGNYPGYDDRLNLDEFRKNLKIQISNLDTTTTEFDLIGIDAAIANAFRRILIAELPSMAIEKVHVTENSSVLPDDVLAHRLGLIPLHADPRLFVDKVSSDTKEREDDTLIFKLKVACKKNPKATTDGNDNSKNPYINSNVYTEHMEWIPIGNQATKFKSEDVGPVSHDILIVKLRPGQEIDLKLVCHKGIGRDHAKFSPVCTASYRLMPEIILKKPIYDEDAEQLQKCFTQGVIELEDDNKGHRRAVVSKPRLDMCSREALRYPALKDCIELNKIRDHFIFSIESVGALSPDQLFIDAIKLVMSKCDRLLQEIDGNINN